MLKRIWNKIACEAGDNAAYYLITAGIYLCGAILAAVCAATMPELSKKELLLYMGDFFTNIGQTGTDGFLVFKLSLLENAKLFGLLFLLSLMVIGTPFIGVLAGIKGFVGGFAIAFLFQAYGVKAALFLLCGMLPHAIVLLPCYAYLFVTCMRFSVSLIRDKYDFKSKILKFILTISALFAVSAAASLLQAYIEPLLIQLISGYFL